MKFIFRQSFLKTISQKSDFNTRKYKTKVQQPNVNHLAKSTHKCRLIWPSVGGLTLPCWWEVDLPKSTQCAKEMKGSEMAPLWDSWGGGDPGESTFWGTFWRWWRLGMHFGASARAQCQKTSIPRKKNQNVGRRSENTMQHDGKNELNLSASVCKTILCQKGASL